MAVKFECKSPVRCESAKKGLMDLFPAFDVDVLEPSGETSYGFLEVSNTKFISLI